MSVLRPVRHLVALWGPKLFAVAAVTLLLPSLPSVARADSAELHDELTDLSIVVGAAGAPVCLAFPVAKRSGACGDLDLTRVGYSNDTQTIAIVRMETRGINVSIQGDSTDPRGEWTPEEARASRAAIVRDFDRNFIRAEHGALEPMRINGLQVFRMQSEIAVQPPTVSELYLFVGANGYTAVRFAYEGARRSEARSIIDSMVSTARARPGASVASRMGSSLLGLLAGAPLVVLAAALAGRKRS